jgi:hypothetical protein
VIPSNVKVHLFILVAPVLRQCLIGVLIGIGLIALSVNRKRTGG